MAELSSWGTRERRSTSGSNADLERVPTLSRLLYGIDWGEWLPCRLTEEIELRQTDIDHALPFIREHYSEIFEQDLASDRFFNEPLDGPKMRYYRASDVFEMRLVDRTVGVLIAAPSDWSTYYFRTMGILPAYRGRQLALKAIPLLCAHLSRAGVRRFEAETSPSNFASVHLLTRMQFNITGTVLSERWGALCRFTRFADENAETVFLDKFCSGIRYQQRQTEQRRNRRGESP